MASAEKEPVIRSGHLLVALLTASDLYQIAMRSSCIFELIPIDTMKHQFLALCQDSIENVSTQTHPSLPVKLQTLKLYSKTPALDQYTINLTHKAVEGKIDPVIGREFEIRLMLDILMRRRQNNPILTGEPGVGKTAVVEGLALKLPSNRYLTL